MNFNKTLAKYGYKPKKGKVFIFADDREKSGIPRHLEDLGATVITVHLPAGDYWVSDRRGIEHKGGNDFSGSTLFHKDFVKNKKTGVVEDRSRHSLKLQMIALREFVPIAELVITAPKGKLMNTMPFNLRSHENIKKLAERYTNGFDRNYKCHIFPTEKETAEFIYERAEYDQKNPHEAFSRSNKKTATWDDKQVFFLQGIPLVGPEMAETVQTMYLTKIIDFFNDIIKAKVIYTKTGNPKGVLGITVPKLGHKKLVNMKKLLLGDFYE